jgi:branched-chain amino acid transport system permease protein
MEYTFSYFLQQLLNGLTLGGVYALIALGYTMVYGIIQLINFAHGEFFAAGGYMGVIILSFLAANGYMETHPWMCIGLAMVLTMGYCAMLAMAVEQVAYKPLRHSSRLSVLLSALGMSIFLQNGLMLTQGV